jgi:plastocyanin
MGGLRGIPLLAAVVLAAYSTPALAADEVVTLGNDNRITPAAVTIDPGNKVTWDWVGPDFNHSPEALYGQAEWFDADPGDGAFPHPAGRNFSYRFTYSGVFQYRCTVHPDTMQGTVTVRGPVAAVTANPATPVVGRPVTFDASRSSDADGAITRYEWDLDGDGAFERSGKAAQQTTTYSTARRVTVRVQATDDKGRRSIALLSVRVSEPAPVAAFLVSPTVTRPHQPVTFDASGTTDADGDIATYEWDLDGDSSTGPGGFEVGTGNVPQTTRSFTGSGTREVRLRVTDAAGNTSVAIEQLTIANLQPSAEFTAAAGRAGETSAFDASGSSDADGAIAWYEWDLDGDGTFETDSGASPRATRIYASPGPVKVGLRVTDNGGAVTLNGHTITIGPGEATGDDPPAGDGGSRDTGAPPRLTARAAAVQRALRTRRVVLRAGCNQACSIVVRGSLRIAGRRALRLTAVTRRMTAGGLATLRLVVPRAAATQLRRALAAHRRATVVVDLRAAAPGRGAVSTTRRITVRR